MAECTNVQIILPARVPIVRFEHRLSDVQCDVSMSEFKSLCLEFFLIFYLLDVDLDLRITCRNYFGRSVRLIIVLLR